MYVCVYVYVCHMCVSCLWTAKEEESVECPVAIGSQDLPSVCARNWTQVLYKSSQYYYSLNHISSPNFDAS